MYLNSSGKKQMGAAILIIVVILLIAALLSLMYAAKNSLTQQKASANLYSNNQAFEAGEAGLEYGFAYLTTNTAAVLANKTGNAVNYTLGTVTLSNNSTYSVTYTSPVNNFTLITIASRGTSSDGTSSKVVTQQADITSNTITRSAVATGTVTLVGGSVLTNTITNLNIQSGGSLTINNGASTVTSSGTTSTQGSYGSDVQQNVAALSAMSDSSFFQSTFGASEATVKSAAQTAGTYYNNSVAGGDYSQTLKNMQGVTIWIDQANASLGQGVTVGTVANPVTLIVNGNFSLANGVTFYGFIYVASISATNTLSLAGGATLHGGMAAAGNINISNNFQLTFNNVAISPGGSSTTIAKIPGSWKDF